MGDLARQALVPPVRRVAELLVLPNSPPVPRHHPEPVVVHQLPHPVKGVPVRVQALVFEDFQERLEHLALDEQVAFPVPAVGRLVPVRVDRHEQRTKRQRRRLLPAGTEEGRPRGLRVVVLLLLYRMLEEAPLDAAVALVAELVDVPLHRLQEVLLDDGAEPSTDVLGPVVDVVLDAHPVVRLFALRVLGPERVPVRRVGGKGNVDL